MKPFILFLSFVFSTSLLLAQNQNESSKIFEQFIQEKRPAYIWSNIDSFSIRMNEKYLIKDFFVKKVTRNYGLNIDTLKLTELERMYIGSSMKMFFNFKWTKELLNENKLDRFTLLDNSEKSSIYQERLVYTIMPPIFIRDASICFFYYSYSCGPLCGQGALEILKKVNGKWISWLSLYHENS